jgi:superfamily II DNA or RNA helicase
MDEFDIINFFPKYANIDKLPDKILNPTRSNFYQSIYTKKEFYDKKLSRIEDVPTEGSGQLMNHQEIISRFMSSHTPYTGLLLIHEMGTGKSCSAFAVTEKIRNETWIDPSLEELTTTNIVLKKELAKRRIDSCLFKGVLVFARGENLINNLIKELTEKCTDGKYLPREWDTQRERDIRIKKKLASYYKFFTFERFAKDLSIQSDEYILNTYSNRIIIIDEVHNLRLQPKKKIVKSDYVNIYKQFWRLLHKTYGCKVLLLSGTPMKDQAEEIAGIMNLLLPEDKQLPTKKSFEEEYLIERTKNNNSIFTVKDDKKQELKTIFKGRVSYLRAMVSTVKKEFIGEKIGELEHFIVDEDNMSDHQTKYYKEALSKDIKENGDDLTKTGVYSNSRQASLFVFPDGSYGSEGFKKYIPEVKKASGNKVRNLEKKFDNEIRGTDDEKLNIIKKYSSKYAKTIKNILENKDKCAFIYCEFVEGSGIILLSELLKKFGYSEAKGDDIKDGSIKSRFAVISNITSSYKQTSNIVNEFNKPRNYKGDYIQVIIGSRVIGEGISLKNVRNINILTPHWNYSETDQAIARGIRVGSHKILIEKGLNVVVEIFQRVSIPDDKSTMSIDLFMYEKSEAKDISIKSMERLLKESAFDCQLNYDRNISIYENMRECEYMNCDYKCQGIKKIDIKEQDQDLSTYNLYYIDKVRDEIIEKVKLIFKDVFTTELDDIKNMLPEYTLFEIITALKTMINESYVINNKYGFSSYIRENNNIYFLIDSLSAKSNIFSEYYIKYPCIKVETDFYDILQELTHKSFPTILDTLINIDKVEKFEEIFFSLSVEIQEIFLEAAILSQKIDIKKNVILQNNILTIMKPYIIKIENFDISTLLKLDSIYRCFNNDNNKWSNCSADILDKIKEHEKTKQQEVVENDYGYSGLLNPSTKAFCIRDLSSIKDADPRNRSPGKVCSSWTIPNLLKILVTLKLKIPTDFKIDNKNVSGMNAEDLFKIIKKAGSAKDLYKDIDKANKNKIDEYKYILYWSKLMKKQGMCENIQKFLSENNLIITDATCGATKKKRKEDEDE